MTWQTMADVEAGFPWLEDYADQLRVNLAFLGGLRWLDTALSDMGATADVWQLAIGTFSDTGSGDIAVTGVGFQPKAVHVTDTGHNDNLGIEGYLKTTTGTVKSLDADGFTWVSLGGAATLGYMCFAWSTT